MQWYMLHVLWWWRIDAASQSRKEFSGMCRKSLLIIAGIAAVLAASVTVHAQGPNGPPLTPKPHEPSHAENAINWCAVHIGRREFAEALVDCDHAVAREAANPQAFSNRGALHLHVGNFQMALVDFEQALRLSPHDAGLYFNRGLALAKLGRAKDAIVDYTAAIHLKPNLAIAYHNRGYEFETLGQRDSALNDYQKALSLDPNLRPPRQAIDRLGKQL